MIKVRLGTLRVQVLMHTKALKVRIGTHVYIHVPSVPSLYKVREVTLGAGKNMNMEMMSGTKCKVGERAIAAPITELTGFQAKHRSRRREVDSDLGCG